jgi:hypothetical protein
VAEGGKWIILGSDVRASWPRSNVGPNDWAGKQWDLPSPFECAVCVAGVLSVAQPLVGELVSQLEKIGRLKTIYGEHVENAIDNARFNTQRRRVDWELRKSYCITLRQWLTGNVPGGKMTASIRKAGEAVIDGTPFPVEILLGGFVRERALFYKASGKFQLESSGSPAVLAIGSGAQVAMGALNRRGQHVDCSLSRSILHVAEALDAAAKTLPDTVGKAKMLTVIHERDGMGQFPLECNLIQGWKNAYSKRPSTLSLQEHGIARNQVVQQLRMHVRRGESPRRPIARLP